MVVELDLGVEEGFHASLGLVGTLAIIELSRHDVAHGFLTVVVKVFDALDHVPD